MQDCIEKAYHAGSFRDAYRFGALISMLLAGLPAVSLLAQGLDPYKAITQYVHDVWGKEDGLPHSTVYAILQTRDGYLWLGTGGGLVRFDGVHFDVFDKRAEDAFTRNRITALVEADDGTLWIGSEGGLLMMMSDGLSELFNPEREMLGKAPIIDRVRHTAMGGSQQVIDGQPQHDDITLVVIKRT